MKTIVIILVSFQLVFGEDYKNAIAFNQNHQELYCCFALRYNLDPDLLKATVFPELIRYSYFKDFFETKALELLYVNGSADVDFSIGHFQMKPSFAEEVEQYLTRYNLQDFEDIVYFYTSNPRKERLERLKTMQGQLLYLSAFIKIMDHNFRETCFLSEEEKVKSYFTAFNSGMGHSGGHLKNLMKQQFFPYGTKVKANQYNYSEIAFDYYTNHLKKEAL